MDAITKKPKPRFLPSLAEAIASWFPELEGRSLAVSEVTITRENIPTLPLAMTAFIRSTAEPPTRSSSQQFQIDDTIIVEFWLPPARYKKQNGTETPFWSYYDYEDVRDTLLTNLTLWEAPGGERISYRGLQIDADPLAVTLTFTFLVVFNWCPSFSPRGDSFKIGFNLCEPPACVVEECFTEPEADLCHPCP